MLASAIPVKIPIPWGASAGGSYINQVPNASQIGINNGYASWTDGWVPLNTIPTGSGGVPPRIQDGNGGLNQISAWSRWYQAGGPIPYDGTFQSEISGYPIGATVDSATKLGVKWYNTVDGNTTNPDTGGAGWVAYSPIGGSSRIVTASGAFTTNQGDQVIGLNRTTSVAQSTTTLPAVAGLVNGQTFTYEDLARNFNQYNLIVSPPAGAIIAGLPGAATLNINGQCSTFRWYSGPSIFSWKA